MKFGLWFEIESASKKADAISAHPEDYFTPNGNLYFLDFFQRTGAAKNVRRAFGKH